MGPLTGLKFIEMAGMGPAPFCGMLLADLGAEVITIGRKSVPTDTPAAQVLSERGKRTIALNLKTPEGVEAVLKLCEGADALFEGFRPGVMEKLGLGPEQCLARNPKLVFGRMTGWGQTGPLAQAPAPRFSRSEATIAHPPKHAGIDTDEVLRGCGYSDDDLSTLREQGVLT
jgi:alpha-methylacyl-CoA racemase